MLSILEFGEQILLESYVTVCQAGVVHGLLGHGGKREIVAHAIEVRM